MPQGIRRPHEAVDYAALERLYPPPPEYFETSWLDDRERIEANLLKYQQAYQAAGQVISLSKELFEQVVGIFR